jgi:hypothetical protein
MRLRHTALFVVVTALLLAKQSGSPGWGDPWELSVAAHVLGITHPPGYPLTLMLAKLLQLLPLNLYVGSALLSTLSIAFCSVLIARIVVELLGDNKTVAGWLGAAAGLLFAITPLALQLGTVLEVYAPAAALTLGLLLNALQDHREPDNRRMLFAALLLGLAISAHLMSLLIVPSIIILHWRGKSRLHLLPHIVFCFLLGWSVALMQPIRSMLFLPMDWAHPFNWERWLAQVSAAQYAGFWGEGVAGGQFWSRLGEIISRMGAWAFIPLAAGGLIILWGKNRPIAAAMTLIWLLTFMVPNFYSIWDIDTYFLPWMALNLILTGYFAVWLVGQLLWRKVVVSLAVACGIILTIVLVYLPFAPLGRATLPYARLILAELPYHSVMFTIGNPSLVPEAMQAVEGLRPDVVLISRPRFNDFWYWKSWERRGAVGLPAGEDIAAALAMTPHDGESGKAWLAKVALTLISNGWTGMGAVAWAPGPDLSPADYSELVELRAGWPVWLWQREPSVDEQQIEQLLRLARECDRQAVGYFAMELSMAQGWAERWGRQAEAERFSRWRSMVEGSVNASK